MWAQSPLSDDPTVILTMDENEEMTEEVDLLDMALAALKEQGTLDDYDSEMLIQ